MKKIQTSHAEIIIMVSDTQDNTLYDGEKFSDIVKGALDTIYRKPNGKLMIDNIVSRNIPSAVEVGYKVKICLREHSPGSTLSGPGPSSKTIRGHEVNAGNKIGTHSAIYWNPFGTQTTDGIREPFIGLAHELVHAWRNAHGIAATLDANLEEIETVGLNSSQVLTRSGITENSIRTEHDMPPRIKYTTGDGVLEHSLFTSEIMKYI
jgi:hypothetical protein